MGERMIIKPDWSKAPEDAQYFMTENDMYYDCWVKQVDDIWFICAIDKSIWHEEDNISDIERCIDDFIPRPVSDSENSWIE